MIPKTTPCLFLKLANYDNYNYIEEHKKKLDEYGEVWILKTGRLINRDFIQEVIEHNGGLILKTPSRVDNKYYFCKLESNEPNESIIYPEYYDEYLKYEGLNFKTTLTNENWFKITSMIELHQSDVEKIIIRKTQRKITECLKSRAVFMYVELKEDIELKKTTN